MKKVPERGSFDNPHLIPEYCSWCRCTPSTLKMEASATRPRQVRVFRDPPVLTVRQFQQLLGESAEVRVHHRVVRPQPLQRVQLEERRRHGLPLDDVVQPRPAQPQLPRLVLSYLVEFVARQPRHAGPVLLQGGPQHLQTAPAIPRASRLPPLTLNILSSWS